jgi:PAS domain S-box-containing protein
VNHGIEPSIQRAANASKSLLRRTIRLSPSSRYGAAVALAAVGTLIRLALDPIWGSRLPYITLFPAIMLSAWIGGAGPGILTTVLTAAAAEYFWIEPGGSWLVHDNTEFLTLGLFVAIGIFMSFLNESWRRGIDAVAASEERLRVTIQSLGDAVIATDEHGRVTQLNPMAESLTGWSQADAAGRPVTDVLVLLNEESRRPADNPVERVLREGTIVGLANHTLLISRAGREIPIDDSAAPVRTDDGGIVGAVMVFRDISERRQNERERAERQRVSQELAAIVESSDDAILGMDLSGRITAWNQAAERMYGYSALDAIGQSIRLTVPEDRVHEEDVVLDRIRHGDRVANFETLRRRQDGTTFSVSLTISPVRNAAGAVIGLSKIARDITARKRVEQEIEERRAQLLAREQNARAEVERASRMKDEFVAVLSHELRTPLNAVLGYAQLLESGALPPERARHALEAIQRNAQAQARLVESLLDLSRALAGKIELDLAPLDLAKILDAAIDVVRPELDAKSITLDVAAPAGGVSLIGDANRLQQVFWNLLSNAVKFTPACGRIRIHVTTGDAHVDVKITDTGQGMAPEFLPYVFDRFRQEGSGRGRSPSGLGLGLAVVQEMVHAHGGTVIAHSDGIGRGSTFTVTLPSTRDVPARSQLEVADGESSEASSLSGLDILVVDDNDDVRELLAFFLESRGATVRAVSSTRDALSAVSRARPDAMLADLRMPDEDGYSLVRQLRAWERQRQLVPLPTIAVTADASRTDRERAIAAGYDWHVAKPIDPDALARLISRLARVENA